MAREAVDKGERQFGQRPHVEVDHLQLFVAIERSGQADQAEAGIVDDKLRLGALPRQSVADLPCRAGLQQIGDDHDRPARAARRDLVGERVQPVFSPRHQRQFMAVTREYARQRHADAGRRPGNHRHWPQAAHPCVVSSRHRPPFVRAADNTPRCAWSGQLGIEPFQ